MDLLPLNFVFHALHFAAGKHRNQRRKGADAAPYINHPIGMVNLLWNEAGVHDFAVITAALLHDTVEDTDTTFAELTEKFGAEVSDLVAEVTDDKSLPQKERKQQQIDHAPHLSPKAKLVKLADKISNLRDVSSTPPDWTMERKRDYFTWAKQVIDPIRGTHPKLEEIFDQVYADGMEKLTQDQP